MKHPIAIFFHGLFYMDGPLRPAPSAIEVIFEQMELIRNNGLLDAAEYFYVGINGDGESRMLCHMLFPSKADVHFHGLECRTENRTIVALEQWLPGHQDWYVLYFHSKGATWPYSDGLRKPWRDCMTKHVLANWRRCMTALDEGFDSAGCHFMAPPKTPEGQRIWAGTFYWATGKYLSRLPSILTRDRIKHSGLDSAESRYEAEVWPFNGQNNPRIKDFHADWDPSKVATCRP